MLTPVAFLKGRASEPRLSQPYVPGRRHSRFWPDEERQVLVDHYERDGAAICKAKLPNRSLTAVYAEAHKLGLKAPNRGPKAKPIGKTLDKTIEERWPFLQGRGSVTKLADELGVKRHTLSQRAVVLGLTLPHKKEPPWTAAEDELLRRAPVNNPEAASKMFAAHGFRRTPTSIVVRCKRAGVSRRRRDVLSAGGAARILGIDNKTMGIWCAEGYVAAERRGTKRLLQQGGDMWTIKPADLRQFVIDQLDRIDIRKVDKHAFVSLLVEADQEVAP